jgi:hypothetical protein
VRRCPYSARACATKLAQLPVLPELDGVVVIDGVTGVALLGLTFQNGVSNGIVAAHGAAVTLNDVTTQNNFFTGIVLRDNSTAEIIDSSSQSNDMSGSLPTTDSRRAYFLLGARNISHSVANGRSAAG